MKRQKGGMPLNCIDKGMFALHTKNELMVLHWVLAITGTVEPMRLRSALMDALGRYPALRATIRTGLLGQKRQVQNISNHNPLTICDLTGAQSGTSRDSDHIGTLCQKRLIQWMNGPLDPATDLPWRVLLLQRSSTESSLVFTFHHSAMDGIGALRFVSEVIESYNGLAEQAPETYQSGDTHRDELRALAHASRPGISHFYLKMMASLCHRFVIAPFSSNTRICHATSSPSPAVYFCQGTLTPHELNRIRSRSKAAGATVNDVLLAAGFRTVDRWNAVHGRTSRKISIMAPVDVGRATSSPGRGNRVSFISVSTAHRERADLEELLRTVHLRTSHMLRNGTAFSIVYAVHFCCRFPPMVPKTVARFLLSTRVYLDSILVTNLGVIWPAASSPVEAGKMGNAGITSVVVLPPVVSAMGIGLSASTYNSHLHVALTYRTSHFSHAEARLLLNLFLHEVRSYQRTPEGALAPEVRYHEERETVRV
jgi:NRPS condensation-like uncharacterized protein